MFHKILLLSDGLPWFSTHIIDDIYILPHKKIMNLHTVHDRAVNNSLISLMYIRMCCRYITVKLNTANRKDGRARFCTATHRFPRRKAPPSLFQNSFSLRENAPWKRKRSAKRKVISYSEKWRSSEGFSGKARKTMIFAFGEQAFCAARMLSSRLSSLSSRHSTKE